MSPEEFSKRPPQGRSPHMRRPLSVDGVLSAPASPPFRPPLAATTGQRPVITPATRPVAPPQRSQPLPPQPQSSQPYSATPLATAVPTAAAPQAPQTEPQTIPGAAPGAKAFTPPRHKSPWRRRLLLAVATLLIISLVAAAATLYFKAQARQHNPAIAFTDALDHSLSSTRLRTDFTSGGTSGTVDYDFSSLTNPIIGSQAHVKLADADFAVQTYGSATSTYVSYQSVPVAVNRQLATAVQNSWIQLRAKRTLFSGINAPLANLADPRYQAFGVVILGNYSQQTRTQLVSFMQAHKVYDYDMQKVTQQTLDGQAVFVYQITLNTDYLKIANLSAATNNKFTPADLQAVSAALDALKGAKATFYVTAKTHYLAKVKVLSKQQETVITYSRYNTAAVLDEPQTKLTWKDFASRQWQMEAQIAAQLTLAARDNLRQAQLTRLHAALASYFAQTGFYPTQTELNNQSWVAANLGGIDPDIFRDPEAVTLQLADTPRPAAIAYQPVSATGKPACDNSTPSTCAHYRLTATLSTKQNYTLQDP